MSRLPEKLKSIRWALITPFILLGVLAGVYGVWWVSLAGTIETAVLDWQKEQSERGLDVAWDKLETNGFPYRLEVKLFDPKIAMPETPQQWGWSAGDLRAEMLPYNLDHVIVDVQSDQTLSYVRQNNGAPELTHFHISSDSAWASLVNEGEGEQRLAVDFTNIFTQREYRPESGPIDAGIATAARLQLHGRPSPNQPGTSFDIAFRGKDISWANFGETPWPGNTVTTLDVQARLSGLPENLPQSLDTVLPNASSNDTKLAISEFRLLWGPIDMKGRGEVTLDELGRPEGKFRTSVGNLDALIAALVEAGIVSQQSAGLAFAGMAALSSLQGEEEGRVRLPVAMKEGVLFLGPIAAARLEPVY
jgi:hypothetical protein